MAENNKPWYLDPKNFKGAKSGTLVRKSDGLYAKGKDGKEIGKINTLKDFEDWKSVAGTNQEGAWGLRLQEKGATGQGNAKGNSTIAKIQAGVSTNTNSDDIKDPKKKEFVKKAEAEGNKQSGQISNAITTYDAGTLTPKSEVKDSKTATKNLQKVTNDIASGKVDTTNNTRAELEQKGQDAAKNPEDLTQPPAQEAGTQTTEAPEMNDVEKSEAQSIGWDGKSTPSPETQEAAQTTVNNISPEEQEKMAESSLGGWEKLAIALTALSFGAAALSGGEIFPVNLIGLTGVDQRLSALHKANAELDKFNKIKEQWNASDEKKNGMSLEDYTALVGKASRNVTEEGGSETNQSEQEQKLLKLQQDHDLKKSELEHLQNMELIDKNGNWDLKKLAAAAAQAAAEGKLNREHAEKMQEAANANNLAIASTAAFGNILGGILGKIPSDENKKKVRHTYIPKEKRGY